MSTNPYEPPKGMDDPRSVSRRRSISAGALSLIAVPTAAFAGGATLLGTGNLVGLLGGIVAGLLVMIVVLVIASRWQQRRKDGRAYYNPVMGLATATPPAVFVGFLLGLRTYDVGTAGGDSRTYMLATVFSAFLIWALGFWLGLQWRAKQGQPSL